MKNFMNKLTGRTTAVLAKANAKLREARGELGANQMLVVLLAIVVIAAIILVAIPYIKGTGWNLMTSKVTDLFN
ncbi:MAG: hypothetical protein RSC08_05875 [Oscillospiraceae bacterium]